jgi:hypothetical protein
MSALSNYRRELFAQLLVQGFSRKSMPMKRSVAKRHDGALGQRPCRWVQQAQQKFADAQHKAPARLVSSVKSMKSG